MRRLTGLFYWLILMCCFVLAAPLTIAQQPVYIDHLAWNKTGTLLAIEGSFKLTIADENGQPLTTLENLATGLAWSPVDPYRLAVSQQNTGHLLIYRFTDNELVVEFDLQTGMLYKGEPIWNEDGTQLAVSGESPSSIQVWDATTGEFVVSYFADEQTIGDIAWRPHHPDEILMTKGEDGVGAYFTLWNAATDTVVWEVLLQWGMMPMIAWSPDGEEFVSLLDMDAILHLHDGNTGEIKYQIPNNTGYSFDVLWNPFTHVLVYDEELEIIDVSTLHTVNQIRFKDYSLAIAVTDSGKVAWGRDMDEFIILPDVEGIELAPEVSSTPDN